MLDKYSLICYYAKFVLYNDFLSKYLQTTQTGPIPPLVCVFCAIQEGRFRACGILDSKYKLVPFNDKPPFACYPAFCRHDKHGVCFLANLASARFRLEVNFLSADIWTKDSPILSTIIPAYLAGLFLLFWVFNDSFS